MSASLVQIQPLPETFAERSAPRPSLENDGYNDVIAYFEQEAREGRVNITPHADGKGNVRVHVEYLNSPNAKKGRSMKTESGLFDSGDPEFPVTISLGVQSGCSLACLTCPAAFEEPDGNLDAEEILFSGYLAVKHSGRQLNENFPVQVTLTGDGDPGVNYPQVHRAIPHIRNVHNGIGQFLTSTAGILHSVDKNADMAIEAREKHGIKLVQMLSLHGSNAEERSPIVTKPSSDKVTVEMIVAAGLSYYQKTDIPTRINYMVAGKNPHNTGPMPDDFVANNRDESAARLAKLLVPPEAFRLTLVEVNPQPHEKDPIWAKPHENDPAKEHLRREHNRKNVQVFAQKVRALSPKLLIETPIDGGVVVDVGCGQAQKEDRSIPDYDLVT